MLFKDCKLCCLYSSEFVHGSILCDLIQPNPSADWPNRTQPI